MSALEDFKRIFAETQNSYEWQGEDFIVFNPHNKPLSQLKVLYGYNAGEFEISRVSKGINARLISEEGEILVKHVSSNEEFMYIDLYIKNGRYPRSHKEFQEKYPDGYRMAIATKFNQELVDAADKLKQ